MGSPDFREKRFFGGHGLGMRAVTVVSSLIPWGFGYLS